MKNLLKLKTKIVMSTSAFVSIFIGIVYANDLYETFPAVFYLKNLDGNNGFTIIGGGYEQGKSVSEAGDVNGDGINDILIGVGFGNSYVVFGSKEPWPVAIDFSNLNGKNGFALSKTSCYSASKAGDVNADGIDDILIGTTGNKSYIVFGSKELWPAMVDLDDLNGTNGFVINGILPDDGSGYSVSGAGDVNGDGIDDMIIGASRANKYAGQSYVVFGSREAWPAEINLFTLNGKNGCILNGVSGQPFGDISVHGAGDVNGDSIDDIIIGSSGFGKRIGQSYVVFGSQEWPAIINLIDLNGINGFAINSVAQRGDGSGWSVSGGGDVNGDGVNDIVIGAPYADDVFSGQSYVVFGHKELWPAAINLADLNGNNGFTINGRDPKGYSGKSVSEAGDVNGDNITDILIGAPSSDSVGQSYIIFGSKEPWPAIINVSNLNGNNGFIITGINPGDLTGFSVSSAGDVNGDGVADIVIGAPKARQSYVIFGERKHN